MSIWCSVDRDESAHADEHGDPNGEHRAAVDLANSTMSPLIRLGLDYTEGWSGCCDRVYLTPTQARALAADLLAQADWAEQHHPVRPGVER